MVPLRKGDEVTIKAGTLGSYVAKRAGTTRGARAPVALTPGRMRLALRQQRPRHAVGPAEPVLGRIFAAAAGLALGDVVFLQQLARGAYSRSTVASQPALIRSTGATSP